MTTGSPGIDDFKIAIPYAAQGAPSFGLNKFNLRGKPPAEGDLEKNMGIRFDPDQRHLAFTAYEELQAAGLIRPTFSDLVSPENWIEITPAGRDALKNNALDDLDLALSSIAPSLVQIRGGAWAALSSKRPDSMRHAAQSGRELIDQALKEGAPDDVIKGQQDFSPDKSSKSGVTRRMRLRFLMKKFRGELSDSDLLIAEKACDLVEAIDKKLQAMSHARTPPSDADLRDALTTAEVALRRVLVG
jgi:hypothetical protein